MADSLSKQRLVHGPKLSRDRDYKDGSNEMLVLCRKVGEDILIGEEIVLRVIRISGGRVRVGIEAPQRLSILRAELADTALRSPQVSRPQQPR